MRIGRDCARVVIVLARRVQVVCVGDVRDMRIECRALKKVVRQHKNNESKKDCTLYTDIDCSLTCIPSTCIVKTSTY